jgi:hypothetical protein
VVTLRSGEVIRVLRAEGSKEEPKAGLEAAEEGRPTEAYAMVLPLTSLPPSLLIAVS